MKNNFHEFRKNKKLKLQNSFIFVDTESNSIKIDDKEILTFKMCCSIFWNRKLDLTERFTDYNVNSFWSKVENRFSKDNKDIIIFAHNTQFDFKMLDGFNSLLKNNWSLVSFYVKNKTFILIFRKIITKKLTYTLHIWDTMNYVNKPLKDLGKSIGLPKLEINFKEVSDKDLEIYCKRDTEIIFQFIKKLIEFLKTYDLSRLKATAGSLSFNIFRHKFYKPINEQNKIYIHDWKKSILLERESYRGGITDNFKLGSFKNVYKLDINSMYSYLMKNCLLPTKLLFYSHESEYNQKQLFEIYRKSIQNDLGVIMKVSIYLPKESAYILNKFTNKSMFGYGKFKITLCLPELLFIEKEPKAKILHIHEINVYRLKPIFKEFITFFFNKKIEYQKKNDLVNVEFTKLIRNTQYGKWAQRDILYKELNIKDDFIKHNSELIKLMIERKKDIIKNSFIIYLGTIVNDCELYIVNKKLYRLKQLKTNAKDSFVAISSFITSYARMLLIQYLRIAKRENVYYCDTDSLFTNKKGFDNLQKYKCIHKTNLGKLKIEGIGNSKFYAPKFYDFKNKRKCKGVKKDSLILNENNRKVVYQIQQWNKLKADLKEGIQNKQIITTTTKTINKIYNKGKIDSFGNVNPFHVSEIIN